MIHINSFMHFISHSAPKHYHLAMHVFGLFTTADTLEDLDDMVQSTAVAFPSTYSGTNVHNHSSKLQSWLQRVDLKTSETATPCLDAEDIKVNPRLFWFLQYY